MRQKWRSEENVIFRGEERSDKIKIGRKKKGWDCIFIDASAKHRRSDDNVKIRKKKSSARKLRGLLRSYSFLNTLKTSLKIFYQEKLLQEKLVIDFCILPFRRFNSKTSKMSICVWKYLRKTITSTTENNFYQGHRRLEEKLFKLQFINKKELRCFKTSGAWTFDPYTFFLEQHGT